MHWDTHGSADEGCPLKCWALFMCIDQHLFFLSRFPLSELLSTRTVLRREKSSKLLWWHCTVLMKACSRKINWNKLIFFLVTWTIPSKRRVAVPRQLLGGEVQKIYSHKEKLNEKIFMLLPKKNSYMEFDNEKKFLGLESSPPPSHNFSNGPSLI